MKFQLKGFVAGTLAGLVATTAIATFTPVVKTLENVITEGISIVIDGKDFVCTNANGDIVEPMIYNGTTYIPVRAVSSAFGKAVAWDGDSYTVYLGDMDGKLEKPTATIKDMTNIATGRFFFEQETNVKDQYGTTYETAYFCDTIDYKDELSSCCEYLLDGKYSKFKATLFVPDGYSIEGTSSVYFIGDGQQIGDPITFTKTTKPLDVKINVEGINDFQIVFDTMDAVYIAHEGFYQ